MEQTNVKIAFKVGDIQCEITLPTTKQNADALINFKAGTELDTNKVGYRAAKRVTKIISQIYLLMDIDRDNADFDFEVKN